MLRRLRGGPELLRDCYLHKNGGKGLYKHIRAGIRCFRGDLITPPNFTRKEAQMTDGGSTSRREQRMDTESAEPPSLTGSSLVR